MSFSKSINNWRKKTDRAVDMVFRGSALEIFSAIIRRTPVKTGRLTANWQAGINTEPSGILDETDKDGEPTERKASAKTAGSKASDALYLINNLPYAQVIENGSSTQAPRGMVKVTIAEWNRIVSKMARKDGV